MCGIVGVLQYESPIPREVRHRALKVLFSETMLRTEARGQDATGLYQVQGNGDWVMAKKGVKVSDYLGEGAGKESKDPRGSTYQDFMDSWVQHPEELSALVGHCRKATVGSKGKDNRDNHPFAVQLDDRNAILGVHNGTLTNHDILFEKMPKLLKRQGTVDSEAIFHMLFHLSDRGTKPWDGEMLKKLGRRLDGSFASIVVNSRFPHIVATFRDARPMEYFLIAPLNIVLVCSERKFAQAALEQYAFIRRFSDLDLPRLSVFDTALIDRDYRIFDTTQEFPKGKPVFQELANISETGKMSSYGEKTEPGWLPPPDPPAKTPATPVAATVMGPTSGNPLKASASKVAPSAANPGREVPQLPAEAGGDDPIITVEVEIGGEEPRKLYERAKSLGVCSHYETPADLARALGLNPMQLKKLTNLELANAIGKLHFNLGYAVCRFDDKTEIESTRAAGVRLTKRVERAQIKKERAEGIIWELKQLFAIVLALASSGYPLSEKNIGISLSAMEQLNGKRRGGILGQAKSIMHDRGIRTVVEDLKAVYLKAKTDKAARQHETTSGGE